MMMHVDMVYGLPTWLQAVLLIGGAVIGSVAIELATKRIILEDVRRQHNDVAAAMFGVIGVTFAVLLAFVVMFTFEQFNAARAASGVEATTVQDVADAASALPAHEALRADVAAYVRAVIAREWPAQAEGHADDSARPALRALQAEASGFVPTDQAQTNFHAALVAALTRLQDARAARLAAAANTVPSVVWAVMLLGGALTIVAGSFLGASSLRMHMVMSATLAASGALVVVLIVALSQPFRGDFRVTTAPFERVLAQLDAR